MMKDAVQADAQIFHHDLNRALRSDL